MDSMPSPRLLVLSGLSIILSALPLRATAPSVSYQFSVILEPEQRRLSIRGRMLLPAVASDGQDLVIVLTESATKVSLQVLDDAGHQIALHLQKQGGSDPPEKRKWLVHLPKGMKDRELRFSYLIERESETIFHVGKGASFAAGIATAWYPQLLDADDNRLPATGRVEFRIPRGDLLCSAGRPLQSPREAAAGGFRYQFDQPVFLAFVSGRFVVHRDGILSLYLLSERRGAISYLRRLRAVIKVLSAEFGPVPYRKFALVEVPPSAAAAAGFDGASLDGFMLAISPYLDRPFNVAFYGHEISHQWWGGVIKRKGPEGAYLMDEAMAQWGSLLSVDVLLGPQAAEQYRRVGHPGYYFEYSGLSYLRRSQSGFDHELSTVPIADGTLSRRMANSKGMLVWDMLAAQIGRPRFREIIQSFIRKNWFRRVSWREFWAEIRSGAGQDLSDFYAQWFERKGAPDWRLTWRQDGSVIEGTITQDRPLYKARLTIEVRGSRCDERLAQRAQVDGAVTTFRLEVPFEAKDVQLDPHFEILRWTEQYHGDADALLPYTRAELELLYGRSDEAKRLFSEALEASPGPDSQGLRFLLEFGLGQSLVDLKKFADAHVHFSRALAAPAKRPEVIPEIFLALADVAAQVGDTAGVRAALEGEANAEKRAAQFQTECPLRSRSSRVKQRGEDLVQ
jgi:hypothetical protein